MFFVPYVLPLLLMCTSGLPRPIVDNRLGIQLLAPLCAFITDGSNLGGRAIAYEPCPDPDLHLVPVPASSSENLRVAVATPADTGWIIIIIIF